MVRRKTVFIFIIISIIFILPGFPADNGITKNISSDAVISGFIKDLSSLNKDLDNLKIDNIKIKNKLTDNNFKFKKKLQTSKLEIKPLDKSIDILKEYIKEQVMIIKILTKDRVFDTIFSVLPGLKLKTAEEHNINLRDELVTDKTGLENDIDKIKPPLLMVFSKFTNFILKYNIKQVEEGQKNLSGTELWRYSHTENLYENNKNDYFSNEKKDLEDILLIHKKRLEENKKLAKELEMVNIELEKTKGALTAEKNKNKNLRINLKNLQENFQKEIETKSVEIEDYKNKEEFYIKQGKELENLINKMKEMETELSELKSRSKEDNEDITRLKEKNKELKDKLSYMDYENKRLKFQKDRLAEQLKWRNSKIKEEWNNKEDLMIEMHEQKEEYKADKNKWMNVIDDYEEKEYNYRKQVKKLESTVKEFKEEITKLKKEITDLKLKEIIYKSDIERLKKKAE